MNKTCTTCKVEKDSSAYNKNKTRKDGLQNVCRDCNKKVAKQYYDSHTVEHRKTTAKRRREKRKEIQDKVLIVREMNPCPCGEKDPACLDFHHLADKDLDISTAINSGWSYDRLSQELVKCVVLCSNCHRKLHAGRMIKVLPIQLPTED